MPKIFERAKSLIDDAKDIVEIVFLDPNKFNEVHVRVIYKTEDGRHKTAYIRESDLE